MAAALGRRLDTTAGEYRATIADNHGHADVLGRWIHGDRLTFETIGTPPVRLRLIWDLRDPDDMPWRNQMSVGGSPWTGGGVPRAEGPC